MPKLTFDFIFSERGVKIMTDVDGATPDPASATSVHVATASTDDTTDTSALLSPVAVNNMALTSSTEVSGQGKVLQHTRRGLKMVGERSFFDLDEPVWHADEKVNL